MSSLRDQGELKTYTTKYKKADGTVATYQRLMRYKYEKKNPTKTKCKKLKIDLRKTLAENEFTLDQLQEIDNYIKSIISQKI